jgi:hypothetical protein
MRERRRETDETEGFVGQQRQLELSKKKAFAGRVANA